MDAKKVNQIGELSYVAGLARGIRDGIDMMLKYGYTEQQVSKVGTSCLEIAMIVENVVNDMIGEDNGTD